MVESRSFLDLHDDMVELLKLFHMISHYQPHWERSKKQFRAVDPLGKPLTDIEAFYLLSYAYALASVALFVAL